jgi:hypothetical protein
MKKTKTKIKTFRTLLIEDGMKAKELAQLVQVKGTHYMNRWGDWEASLPGNSETKDVIDAAIDALADYVSAEINRDSQRVEEFYDRYTHHPLDNFGFTIGDNNELFIELVNGKAIDSKQASKKVKRNKPRLTTDNGKLQYFKKETFIPLVEKVVKKNPKWQYSQISKNSEVKDALANSGLSKGTPSVSVIKKWITKARKNASVKPPVGAPTNQTSSLNTP